MSFVLANLLFFAPVAALAWIAARVLERKKIGTDNELTTGISIVFVSMLAYGALGFAFTSAIGPHAGDEGHYLLQMRSLYEDGDLDLRNNLLAMGETHFEQRRHILLISFRPRGDHVYSWLPYGLPVLLAPLHRAGFPAIHAVLGLLAGLGLLGTYRLCRASGADRTPALVLVGVIGASTLWAVYSARVLPEILSATLLVWTAWAVARQVERPTLTAVTGALCGAGMMFAHPRLIPLSLLCAATYFLLGVARTATRKSAILFSAIYGCLAAGYAAIQFSMFVGGTAYEAKLALFGYPAGAWGILAENRGILASFPAIAWLLAANVEWLRRDSTHRPVAALALLVFFANLAVNCTNVWYLGGSSLSGRYLLSTVPLLAPGAAFVFASTHRTARVWLLFLALTSTAVLVLLATRLPDFGKAFSQPDRAIPMVYPALRGLLHPLPAPMYKQPEAVPYLLGSLSAVFLYIGTWVVVRGRESTARLAMAVIALMAVISHPFQPEPPAPRQPKGHVVKAVHAEE